MIKRRLLSDGQVRWISYEMLPARKNKLRFPVERPMALTSVIRLQKIHDIAPNNISVKVIQPTI